MDDQNQFPSEPGSYPAPPAAPPATGQPEYGDGAPEDGESQGVEWPAHLSAQEPFTAPAAPSMVAPATPPSSVTPSAPPAWQPGPAAPPRHAGQQPDYLVPADHAAVPEPDTGPRGPNRRRWPVVISAVVVVVLLAAGGTAGVLKHRADERAAEKAAQAAAAKAREKAEEAAREKAQQEAQAAAEAARQARIAALQAIYDDCSGQLTSLLSSLQTVDSRLDVGVNQGDYAELVGDASVAYGQVDVKALSEDCLPIGAKLETALNDYITVNGTWNNCIYDDYFCSTDDIEPQMQGVWAKASRLIRGASNALKALKPDPNGDGYSTSSGTANS
jgi:hypothetical protein